MCHSLIGEKKRQKQDGKPESQDSSTQTLANTSTREIIQKNFMLELWEIRKLIEFASRDKGRHDKKNLRWERAMNLFPHFHQFDMTWWKFFSYSSPSGNSCIIGFPSPRLAQLIQVWISSSWEASIKIIEKFRVYNFWRREEKENLALLALAIKRRINENKGILRKNFPTHAHRSSSANAIYSWQEFQRVWKCSRNGIWQFLNFKLS